MAGASASSSPTGAIRVLHHASGGLPRVLNHLATQALLEGMARGASGIDEEIATAAAEGQFLPGFLEEPVRRAGESLSHGTHGRGAKAGARRRRTRHGAAAPRPRRPPESRRRGRAAVGRGCARAGGRGAEDASDLVFPADPAPASRGGGSQLPASGTGRGDPGPGRGRGLGPRPRPPTPSPGPCPAATALAEPQRAASISFFSAPAREERAAVEATEHLATFFLDREEYGVDVRLVQEISRVTEITPVPRAPEFIKGVINLRGRIIPVVDLKRKLGLGEVAESRAARIVVVKIQDRLIGMLVDGASQVLKVPVSSIEPAPDEVVEKGGDYIRGVAKLEKRLIILVDLHRILLARAARGRGAASATA